MLIRRSPLRPWPRRLTAPSPRLRRRVLTWLTPHPPICLQVEAPLLFLHGPHDNIVPIDVGRRLFEASNEPKRFVTIPRGDHNNLPFIGGEQYYGAIEQHLRQHVDP